jgi:hypothetical protein
MTKPHSGKKLLVVLFALLFAAIAFIFYVGATGGGTGGRAGTTGDAREVTGSTNAGNAAAVGSGVTDASAAVAKHLADRRARDELRQRILAGWAAEGADEETRTAAKAGRFVPRPNPDGRGIEPKYIQEVVREDLFPMARKCYEDLLARKPDAGGRLEMEFTIAGDDKIGGIVEEASMADTSSLKDEKMETCVRESLLTLSFPPPAHDGVVTVVYPIVFGPGDDDEK